ncbi:MAG TPA: dihydrofolate reductase family protein [Candidatus Acidoferrales bacterium]|nr:dihydrofolate reductase family protein [Candidatus Acidoferrales bacterium]
MKTSVFIATSLDGFIARKDGNIDWLVEFENPDVNSAYAEFIGKIDSIVIGRGTFETALAFPSWPYDRKVFVLSTTMRNVPERLKRKIEIVAMKPKELLNYISRGGYSNLYIDGGKVIQSFLTEDLIDEMTITRVPVLLGSGIPLFDSLDREYRFEHLETKVYPNGLVRSRYERKRG